MDKYIFWNNKGGTGKTSLAFHSICLYAKNNPNAKILVIDLCPQANLSELLLGGLEGGGSNNLLILQDNSPRKTIGGYFQDRLPSPFTMPQGIDPANYISSPKQFNSFMPANIDLMAGDAIIELQSNSIATLSNTQVPGTNTWLAVIDWVNDLVNKLSTNYSAVFIDANPSFSIYTQIALASSDKLVIPVMADDSSRRAVQNVFSLVHGLNLPSPIYNQHAFSAKLLNAGRQTPKIHLFAKNRLTQYMGPASAYDSVIDSIVALTATIHASNPVIFTFANLSDGFVDIRDFQTTGVVSVAKGQPFYSMNASKPIVGGKRITIKNEYLRNCRNAIDALVAKL